MLRSVKLYNISVPTTTYWNERYRCHIYASDNSEMWLEVARIEDSEFPGIRCRINNLKEAESLAKNILNSNKFLSEYDISWATDGQGVNHRIADF